MGYTLVIMKIRFEDLAVILHFPHFTNTFHFKNNVLGERNLGTPVGERNFYLLLIRLICDLKSSPQPLPIKFRHQDLKSYQIHAHIGRLLHLGQTLLTCIVKLKEINFSNLNLSLRI